MAGDLEAWKREAAEVQSWHTQFIMISIFVVLNFQKASNQEPLKNEFRDFKVLIFSVFFSTSLSLLFDSFWKRSLSFRHHQNTTLIIISFFVRPGEGISGKKSKNTQNINIHVKTFQDDNYFPFSSWQSLEIAFRTRCMSSEKRRKKKNLEKKGRRSSGEKFNLWSFLTKDHTLLNSFLRFHQREKENEAQSNACRCLITHNKMIIMFSFFSARVYTPCLSWPNKRNDHKKRFVPFVECLRKTCASRVENRFLI